MRQQRLCSYENRENGGTTTTMDLPAGPKVVFCIDEKSSLLDPATSRLFPPPFRDLRSAMAQLAGPTLQYSLFDLLANDDSRIANATFPTSVHCRRYDGELLEPVVLNSRV